MDIRKLISFGKTSYVISLPKDWVKRNNLQKGDMISLQEHDGGDITVSSNNKKPASESTEVIINVDKKDANRLQREITSAYINNYNPIVLVGTELKSKAAEIKNTTKNLIALEIMQQTSDKIIARDFLNMEKVSIPSLVRKMDIIVRDMIVDCKKCFEEDLYESIYGRDDDINRLNFLIFRAIKSALQNPDILRAYKTTTYELVTQWFVNLHLEKIGDHIKRIARNMKIMKNKITPKNAALLLETLTFAEKRYLDTIKAYYNNDTSLAYGLASTKKEALDSCAYIATKHKQYDVWVDTIDKIKQMVADTHDIVRTVYLFLLKNS